VQLEEFDERLADYGLLISTFIIVRTAVTRRKNEIHYDINVILWTQSDDKARQNYGTVGQRNGNIDEG
jgi:hypothetical protein